MKIAIVGAGAIGGYLGARLADSGEEVTFIARGPNLAAIQANGMRLRLEDGTEIHAKGVGAFEKMRDAGKQDFVLLTLKAHQVGAIAADLAYLCHDDTAIVTMQNGIPWWYFYKHGGALEGTKLKSSDPDGKIAAHLDPARVIGSVVYPAANLVLPGVVEVVEGNRFSLGELDGTTTPRLQAIAGALIKAGFRTPIARDIRAEIWLKLWGNTSLNPVCALTHATLEDVCRFLPTRALIAAMMAEAEAVANALGVQFKISIEKRIAGAEAVGAHKPSTLQDVELGRPLELDALVGAVIELSDLLKVPTPNIRAIYACVSMLAQTLNKQHGKLRITS
ncbi:MAG TPA: 2-dehydropantoate 2-reductase [Burkholderiaceae bacterium]|nr:2-dehydropantoate 2-reductase [Burkholderiaceae bacterium]